jgi:hypothetical protein
MAGNSASMQWDSNDDMSVDGSSGVCMCPPSVSWRHHHLRNNLHPHKTMENGKNHKKGHKTNGKGHQTMEKEKKTSSHSHIFQPSFLQGHWMKACLMIGLEALGQTFSESNV